MTIKLINMNSQESQKLKDKVLKKLHQYIEKSDTVIAAISGGPDSMFLLHFLKKIPCKTIVAHFNHKIRKESDSDQKFVQQVASVASNLLPLPPLSFHSKTLDIKKLARQKKQGIEETGREERYIFFRQLFKKYRAKYIITAHHADDNLETIILNFTRGATLQGLQGMQESEPPLLRPLLQFSKKQILDYLHHKKIPYKIDITNEEKKYFRNFIRHDIIPKLRKLNPNLPDTTAKNAENIREINNFLKQEAQNFLKNFLKGNRHHQLDAKKFRRQHLALQKQILLEAHKNLTGKTTDITSVNLDEILTMINKNIGNKHKKLGRLTISIKKNIMELKK